MKESAMALTCSKCSRVNPAGASFCYHDGVALTSRHGQPAGGAGRAFPNPFVFPSGRTCRTFDELALALDEHWREACDLLREGYLEKFFAGLGRADLALAAREAAHFPDRDRGLDQLLAQLPAPALKSPRLAVEPREITLGTLALGVDRSFELCLSNRGMRLLYGSVTCEGCPWLALGEGTGTPEKLFEFDGELILPVHVRGQRLRASAKPQEGRLLVESNAGTATVLVRADVPVVPFPDGILAGARTPREIAQKAKDHPAEAAALFESGAVARWYQANGWDYPVKVPAATGLGAVQQFFEALGLTAPPRVDLSERVIHLQAAAGESLRHILEVRAHEKRPVWAHASSDQPWLEVGRPRLNGRSAAIPLAIPAVPNRPGETLKARVVVTTNGNQRFVVPVTLEVGENWTFTAPTASNGPVTGLALASPITPEASPYPQSLLASHGGPRTRSGLPGWVHALPAAFLVLALAAVVLCDTMSTPARESDQQAPVDLAERPAAKAVPPGFANLVDTEPRIQIGYNSQTERFGLVSLKERDPKNPQRYKRLTSSELGANNNTCIRINGSDFLFGWPPGKLRSKTHDRNRHSWVTVWEYPQEDVEVTQTVILVPGDRHLLDTCLVRYTLRNRSAIPKTIGLRVMLDTYIGSDDGVPFSVPGRDPPLVEDLCVLNKLQIPDYIQALERPDPANPGTVAHLGLKGFTLPDVALEEPSEVVICRWPKEAGGQYARWKWEFEPINQVPTDKDSCVALYWSALMMNEGETREMAFTYGLNAISSEENTQGPKLGLYAPGRVRAGDEFTATVYVKKAQADKPVELTLPAGFVLLSGEPSQSIKAGGEYTQVSWRVRAGATGDYTLTAGHDGVRVKRDVSVVNKKSIFD
jgi:hypothetical protein